VKAASPRTVAEVVRAALRAGAPAVQLRDKLAGAGELLEAGRAVLPLVREAGALLFVNDRLDVALALGADGVHVGPDDLPVEAARRAAPAPFLVGTSTDDPQRARELVAAGADYIGCGTVYATTSKPDAGAVIGLEGLQRVVEAVDVPVVGIGGIDAGRSAEVAARTGASGVAVIGAVMGAANPEAAVRELLVPWQDRGGSGAATA
jgi:thiamine-phosphate pyrophosphorylase